MLNWRGQESLSQNAPSVISQPGGRIWSPINSTAIFAAFCRASNRVARLFTGFKVAIEYMHLENGFIDNDCCVTGPGSVKDCPNDELKKDSTCFPKSTASPVPVQVRKLGRAAKKKNTAKSRRRKGKSTAKAKTIIRPHDIEGNAPEKENGLDQKNPDVCPQLADLKKPQLQNQKAKSQVVRPVMSCLFPCKIWHTSYCEIKQVCYQAKSCNDSCMVCTCQTLGQSCLITNLLFPSIFSSQIISRRNQSSCSNLLKV